MRRLILAVSLWAASPATAAPFDGLVDIGGRSIRIACQGTAAPTVIVETGMGSAGTTNKAWQDIARRIAPTTQICLYDRAGLGGSGKAPAPTRTSDDAVADLDRGLRAAKIGGPIIIAAHSIGGLHALDYARLHPNQVAGLVLISSTHPDQDQAWLAALPAETANDPPPLAQARRFLKNRQADPATNPERLLIEQSNIQVRKLKTLGDRPLIVLTHSPRWKMIPDMPDAILVPLEHETQRLQRDFLRLSRRSKQTIAATAGHGLPEEDPSMVEAGILDAVRMVRRR